MGESDGVVGMGRCSGPINSVSVQAFVFVASFDKREEDAAMDTRNLQTREGAVVCQSWQLPYKPYHFATLESLPLT